MLYLSQQVSTQALFLLAASQHTYIFGAVSGYVFKHLEQLASGAYRVDTSVNHVLVRHADHLLPLEPKEGVPVFM